MVQQPVNHARLQGDELYEGVTDWLHSVDEFISEGVAKSIIDVEDRAKKSCFKGLCPNLISRYKLSKQAAKAAEAAASLVGKGNFSNVSYRPAPKRAEHMQAKDFEAFDSRMKVLQDVVEALKDDKLKIIGVYGMGGVGKTTLVKQVAKQVMEDNLFDKVAMAVASRLRERLKQEKRVLIILDNIWTKLELDAVGIPSGDVDEKDKEALQLFEKIVGDSTKTSAFQPITNEIVKRCGALPVALRNSNSREIHGMDANVYTSIELSYKFLESDEAKSLFLLCGLYGQGHSLEVPSLLRNGMGLGLFKNVYTLEAARNRVDTLIDILKSSCLLLDGDAEDEAKMHDIIHAIAVSIASEKLMFNIPNVADLKEEIERTIEKEPTAISLPLNKRKASELPERLECPKLKLLLLFTKFRSSLIIPDLFFEGMKQLKVLHFTNARIPSLPSSLGCLFNVQTLCLDGCVLNEIAIIGQLKKLDILSFRDSNIEQLPLEIGQLTRLRLLDLSNCWNLEVIAPNVISKLSRLEELYMDNSFSQWDKVEGGSNASLTELKGLSKLTTLEIDVPDAEILPQDLVFVELQRYRICIGDKLGQRHVKSETSRLMILKRLGKVSILLENYGTKMLMKRTEDLCLRELKGVQNVVHELDDGEGFPQLKHLNVTYCSCWEKSGF
ncbi:Disease resistance protein [Citrus sinensis]|uniref:Disease resistance protein n=1 Tax=Citrus sinensis TaxID=2711 RepID=A0ACB8KFC8_CITSI|nr:Disease resistance protein [Citrus sinensis]